MVSASSLHLAESQYNHAVGIVAACKRRGLPVRGAHVALETALTESVLWMYANGHNQRSLQLPHDRVGWDHGSVGLFQQQVGGAPDSTANWGTTDELMDAVTSTGKFLDALGPLSSWQHKTNWMAVRTCSAQRSATEATTRKTTRRRFRSVTRCGASARPRRRQFPILA